MLNVYRLGAFGVTFNEFCFIVTIAKLSGLPFIKDKIFKVKYKKTFFESIEDLELLRVLESSIKVKCRFLNYHEDNSIDTPEDLIKVRNKLSGT